MLLDLPISQLSQKIKTKQISPVDLIEESYRRIATLEKILNATITLVDKKSALSMARKLESKIKPDASPIYGLPFVMKDAFLVSGLPTTAASKILDKYIPPYSSTVYNKLEAAGAILIGKMNMDAWGHGASTENTDYGPTRNPWDTSRSAGGSGGGPAAALAARYCAFGIGEDTGGSIRNPAAWCNVSAMKVSYGRVSRYGAIAYASSLDTMGPTGKSVEDCAHILSVIAGNDPYDATSAPRDVPDYVRQLVTGLKGKKIALPREFFDAGLDPEIKSSIEKAREVFVRLGATVEEISMPMLEFGVPVYYILAPSETSSNLGRYDSVRYGGPRNLFTRESKRRIMTGTYALSSGYYDAYYKKAQKARTVFIEKYTSVLHKFDCILAPVNPTLPPKFGELLDDPVKNMMADLYTVTVNIVGLPALALPCGFSRNGLPIGMQLIGRMFDEDNLFALGHAYQTETDWHKKIPEIVKI